jgi:ubiquinone/menaquinone biosynthesis C-methylase UbiE
MTNAGDQDLHHLRRFASVGLCPRCWGELQDVAVSEAGLVCPKCSYNVCESAGVVTALPIGELGASETAEPAGDSEGWAAGIAADMDAKSDTYVDKYERRTRASAGFFTRREHALEMAGGTPGRVLEAGCGPGVVAPMLSDLGVDTHGVDLSAGQLQTAARRDPRTLYVQGDLERLPYRSGMFDTIMLLGVFEYVERPESVARELARVMKTEGRLIVSVPNARGLERLWVHYVYLPSSRLAKRMLGKPVPSYSRRLYSLGTLAALLEKAGLRIEQARYFDVVLAAAPLDRLLGDGMPRVATSLEKRLQGRLRRVMTSQIIVSAVGRHA